MSADILDVVAVRGVEFKRITIQVGSWPEFMEGAMSFRLQRNRELLVLLDEFQKIGGDMLGSGGRERIVEVMSSIEDLVDGEYMKKYLGILGSQKTMIVGRNKGLKQDLFKRNFLSKSLADLHKKYRKGLKLSTEKSKESQNDLTEVEFEMETVSRFQEAVMKDILQATKLLSTSSEYFNRQMTKIFEVNFEIQ